MKCCLCGNDCENQWGNNPYPYGEGEDRCCNVCNTIYVIPARMEGLRPENKKELQALLNNSLEFSYDEEENM